MRLRFQNQVMDHSVTSGSNRHRAANDFPRLPEVTKKGRRDPSLRPWQRALSDSLKRVLRSHLASFGGRNAGDTSVVVDFFESSAAGVTFDSSSTVGFTVVS